MTGHDIRFKRFLPDGENAVVVAIDHGEFSGPLAGIADLREAAAKVAEADGILLSPGGAEQCGGLFMKKGGPSLIVRLNWSSSYALQWGYNGAHVTGVVTPEDALALGADAGLASCTIKTGCERTDAENIAMLAGLARAKRRCGLPLVGEYYPVRRESLSAQQLHEQVVVACRVLGEIGADAVKTFYTGRKFREVVSSAGIPVFVLGADKYGDELDALQVACDAVGDGARGVFFGRNVTQARDPARFLKALKLVVKKGLEPAAAAKEAGL